MSDKPIAHVIEDYEGICETSRRQDVEIGQLRALLNEIFDQECRIARSTSMTRSAMREGAAEMRDKIREVLNNRGLKP